MAVDVVFTTPRLRLCRFQPEDAAAHRALLDAPDLARLLPVPTPIADDLAAAVFAQVLALAPDDGWHLAIRRHGDDEILGTVGVQRDRRDRHGALSLGLAAAADRRQGLGTEAAVAVIEHGFATGLRKVWFQHHGDNVGVRAAAMRLGFVEVGRQREHCRLDGAWVDWVTMELRADAWRGAPVR